MMYIVHTFANVEFSPLLIAVWHKEFKNNNSNQYNKQFSKMANVAANRMYTIQHHSYLPVTKSTTTSTGTGTDLDLEIGGTEIGGTGAETGGVTLIPLEDQVDNNTHSSEVLKNCFNRINRMNDKYHREDERLRTYDNNWPLEWLDKRELAMTGMFYTNQDDKVKCYFCEVEIGRWERDDQPVPEHLRWSPNCPLLRRRTTNNLPLNQEALERILPPVSYDICGSNDNNALDVLENSYSERQPGQSVQPLGISFSPALQLNSAPANMQARANGTSAGGNYFPEYPEYAIETARLRSFQEWPRNLKQRPEQLAEAGFFYCGVGDRVRCFSCGGGLKDWDNNDEPWEQHALWLSHCRFVKLIKGQLYIDAVRAAAAGKDECSNSNSTTTSSVCNATPTSNSSRNTCLSTDTMVASSTVAAASQMGETLQASPAVTAAAAIEGGAAPTAAGRIYDKIVSQTCTEGSSSSAAAVSASTSIPEEKLCKICYGAEYNTAFLPCGHVVACAKCASSVTKCPLCRKPFTDVMRVYFS